MMFNLLSMYGAEISTVANVVMAMSAVATAVSAIVAVVHFKKHWRDDDVFATIVLDDACLHELGLGRFLWSSDLLIVNSGKTAFSVYRATAVDELGGKPLEIVLSPGVDKRLDQGTYFKTRAIVMAVDDKVSLPEEFVITVIDPNGFQLGRQIAHLEDARPAGEKA